MKRRRYWYNLLRYFGLALFLAFSALLVTVCYRQAWLLTHPPRQPVRCSPASYGLSYEEASFPSTDGLRLAGWYVPSRNGTVVILCHGLRANRCGGLPLARMLADHGYGALLFDFRACGESEGEVTTYGAFEVYDLLGAVRYLRGRPEVKHIAVIGYSLGGVVAIRAAARAPDIEAVIVEGAFASLEELSNQRWGQSFLARIIAPLTTAFAQWQTGARVSAVRPVDDIGLISPRPVLLIHGTADVNVPPEHSRRLFAAAREPKELWMPEGIGHCGAFSARPVEFERRVVGFLEQHLPQAPSLLLEH